MNMPSPSEPPRPGARLGRTALILGIAGLLLWPLSFAAMVFALRGAKEATLAGQPVPRIVVVARVLAALGIAALILAILYTTLG